MVICVDCRVRGLYRAIHMDDQRSTVVQIGSVIVNSDRKSKILGVQIVGQYLYLRIPDILLLNRLAFDAQQNDEKHSRVLYIAYILTLFGSVDLSGSEVRRGYF